jgi:uncharacterized membrane protein (DUF106 family)
MVDKIQEISTVTQRVVAKLQKQSSRPKINEIDAKPEELLNLEKQLSQAQNKIKVLKLEL